MVVHWLITSTGVEMYGFELSSIGVEMYGSELCSAR